MALTEQDIQDRIARLTRERDEFLAAAQRELAMRSGAITALQQLLDESAPAEPNAADIGG